MLSSHETLLLLNVEMSPLDDEIDEEELLFFPHLALAKLFVGRVAVDAKVEDENETDNP
jgi:hypothetical protein